LDFEEEESKEQLLEFTVDAVNNGIRVDKYLSAIQAELSRSYLQKLIEEGRAFMEEKPVKSNYRLLRLR
jgi:23S rRNA pseudouridine1911/1915/1917 synthase